MMTAVPPPSARRLLTQAAAQLCDVVMRRPDRHEDDIGRGADDDLQGLCIDAGPQHTVTGRLEHTMQGVGTPSVGADDQRDPGRGPGLGRAQRISLGETHA